MFNNETVTKQILRIAVIASLYVALTISLSWMSYGDIQFRIAEILVLLCFFRKDYNIALIIGCAIANLFSPMGIVDVVFGTIATALSVLFVSRSKNIIVASVYPVVFNSLIVGLELHYMLDLPFIPSAISVLIGEAAVMVVGCIIFKTLRKSKSFVELIRANQNINEN